MKFRLRSAGIARGLAKSLLCLSFANAICDAALDLSPNETAALARPPVEFESGVGRWCPDLAFTDVSGGSHRFSELKADQGLVIAFLSPTCPVSKRFAPTLAAIEKAYLERGVRFVFVDPIPSDTDQEIANARTVHGIAGPITRDTNGGLRAALNPRTTTEVFVLDAARTLVYRGAVDDQYGLNYSLEEARHHFLKEALEAMLVGRPPDTQATTAPGCALEPVVRAPENSAPVTYHNRISRIAQAHCLECHRAGGVAPFALESFAEVTSHAGMIRKVLDRGVMPPWFASPAHGGEVSPWANDRSLAADDKRDFLAWLAGGKPEGDPKDAPLGRTFPRDWEVGTPDVVYQIEVPLAVKATGKMPYQNVVVHTTLAEDRWIEALEVRPTSREVVHHVLVFVVPKEKVAAAEANVKRGRDNNDGDFFAVYVPGNNVLRFRPGMAKLLPAGAGLHFQIHYTPNGTATTDQTRIGLVFAKQPPKHQVRVSGIVNVGFRIPPGADNYEVTAKLPVLFDAQILAFMPHMHVRGKAFRFDLKYPDGTIKPLLEVPRYDFNWQLQYRLREPIAAPAGSELLGTAWYDNSTNNPANPDPTREVKWGPQTDEEMMLGYFEYFAVDQKPGEKATLAQLITRDGGASLIFNGLDKNHDGKITGDESPSPQAFTEADENRDGVVTLAEFKSFLRKRQSKEN